VIIIVVNP